MADNQRALTDIFYLEVSELCNVRSGYNKQIEFVSESEKITYLSAGSGSGRV